MSNPVVDGFLAGLADRVPEIQEDIFQLRKRVQDYGKVLPNGKLKELFETLAERLGDAEGSLSEAHGEVKEAQAVQEGGENVE